MMPIKMLILENYYNRSNMQVNMRLVVIECINILWEVIELIDLAPATN